MNWIKWMSVLCLQIFLLSLIVDFGYCAKSWGSRSKSSSSKSSSSSSSSRYTPPKSSGTRVQYTTARQSSAIKYTTPRPSPIRTAKPVSKSESSNYPKQEPFNPYFPKPQPQPPKPQPQPTWPQPQPHWPQQQPHWPQQQPHWPQQQPHWPQQQPSWQQPPPYIPYQPVHPVYYEKPRKPSVAKDVATHVAAGLGGAYVHHQFSKHSNWYEKRQHEREEARREELKKNPKKNHTLVSTGIAKLTPVVPFKVRDFQHDSDGIMQAGVMSIKLLDDAQTRYGNDPQKNEISKAAEANSFLFSKLRPSQSETLEVKNITTKEFTDMVASGKLAKIMMGGNKVDGTASLASLGALGTIGGIGTGTHPIGVVPVNTSQSQQNITITGGQTMINITATNPNTPSIILNTTQLNDPQVLPLVMKELLSEDSVEKKLRPSKTRSSSTSLSFSKSLVLICMVTITLKRFY